MTMLTRRLRKRARQVPEVLIVVAVALCVEVGLRITTLPRLARLLGAPLAAAGSGQSVPTPPTEGARPATLPVGARRSVRATMAVMRRWPLGDTCLRQALVSGQRLRRLGPLLHVGVAKAGGEVRAHAWLTVGDIVIDPLRAAADYLPLGVPPSGPTS